MKHLLCYGDSNTWGQDSFAGRIADELQWPNILQAELADFKVIQEGVGGRVAGEFNTKKPYLNGKSSYEVTFRSASPVEIVIIALGTNDLNQQKYTRSAKQITDDLLWYAQESARLSEIFDRPHPRIIYLLPANFTPGEYYGGNEEVRQELISLMKQTLHECIELPPLTMTTDGVHYTHESHEKVAELVRKKITEK